MDMADKKKKKLCRVTGHSLKTLEFLATKSFCQNKQFRNIMKEGMKMTLPAPNFSLLHQRMQGSAEGEDRIDLTQGLEAR